MLGGTRPTGTHPRSQSLRPGRIEITASRTGVVNGIERSGGDTSAATFVLATARISVSARYLPAAPPGAAGAESCVTEDIGPAARTMRRHRQRNS